jgi:hypothetical protein
MRIKDLIGQRFGRLVVTEYIGRRDYGQNGQRCTQWECRCDCGNTHVAVASDLKKGSTRSCGCFRSVASRERRLRHGHTVGNGPTPEYRAYIGAKGRCQPNSLDSQYYAKRGIEFRFNSFEDFLGELGPRPDSNYTVDRIDTNGHYEIGNVRWATWSEQRRNQRRGASTWNSING